MANPIQCSTSLPVIRRVAHFPRPEKVSVRQRTSGQYTAPSPTQKSCPIPGLRTAPLRVLWSGAAPVVVGQIRPKIRFQAPLRPRPKLAQSRFEIGRASCREREQKQACAEAEKKAQRT